MPVESVTIKGQPASVVHGGAPFKLTAEVLPNNADNKAVTWKSSHPAYMSVDNQGYVTIKGYTAETITITATSVSDKTKTASSCCNSYFCYTSKYDTYFKKGWLYSFCKYHNSY